jgi:dihydrofolate reductase
MRKVTFGCANSLDNYIARPDGGLDWLRWSEEAAALTGDYWAKIDTILMGRKTFEFALAHDQVGEKPDTAIKTYVFSRSLRDGEYPGVKIVADDAAGFVRNLKEQQGREICVMGGGDFAKTLFEAGLIDEVGFNVHPVLLGGGVPLFHPMDKQVELELIEAKSLKNGCVFVSYRVK